MRSLIGKAKITLNGPSAQDINGSAHEDAEGSEEHGEQNAWTVNRLLAEICMLKVLLAKAREEIGACY